MTIGDYQVYMAAGGREGIKAAKKVKPDLILLDIMMPDMDGQEVLKTLKQSNVTMSIPVIMLSALGDEDSKVQAAQSYSEGYLVKPVEPAVLKAKIEEILKGSST